ncbi:MAG: DUF4388 domain-containing protein [Myxococcota bacterium]
MKVLVVDDEKQADLLARTLGRRRPELTFLSASTGAAAIEAVRKHAVDAVLTDVGSAEPQGRDFLLWLAANEPALPVFTMSVNGDADAERRLEELGALECFRKPVDVQALLSKLDDAFAQMVEGQLNNVSLASLLQLMEMERKTCSLTVRCHENTGVLFLNQGQLVDARSGSLAGEAAAMEIISWPHPNISISRDRGARPRVIETSLGFIVMEAMRVHDEESRRRPLRSERPAPAMRGSLRPAALELDGARLPVGVHALVFVDTATGQLLGGTRRAEFALEEVAATAAQLLRQALATFALCGVHEPEELVIAMKTQCELMRPLDAEARTFALAVFSPKETNLVMTRIETERFVAARRSHIDPGSAGGAPRDAQRTP